MDGYVGSPYTIAIGALDRNDEIPEYQEVCAAQMAVTYSSNNKDYIVTTDTKSGCTDRHGGTSAAAPIAAGLIALVLQVNPLLSWRDVQWLIAKTSIKVNPDHPDWMTNAAGFHHNHYYGFGNLDITAMIQEASEWESIDKSYTSLQWKSSSVSPEQIDAFDSGSFVVEHVIVELDVDRVKGKGRGDIQVQLISPSGTPSWLVTQRTEDRATPSGFDGWKVMTVRCWGESPEGVWKLNVMNGRLNSWVLNVYGSQ
jgi:subtilisin family serine protease